MLHPRIAIYPGTFDPLTLGHEDVVRRALRLFDHVILAVAIGHHKKTMFSIEERLALAQSALQNHVLPSTAPCADAPCAAPSTATTAVTMPRLQILPFAGLLRDFARLHGARAVLRGIRAVSDFDYEYQLAGINRQLMPEVESVFLTPSDQHQFTSSTFVREIATLGGDVSQLVSPCVVQALQKKLSAQAPINPL